MGKLLKDLVDGKVSKEDIVDDLTGDLTGKVASAEAVKEVADAIPSNSDLIQVRDEAGNFKSDNVEGVLAEVSDTVRLPVADRTRPEILIDFESTTGWTGAAMSADTTDYVSGKQSFLLTGMEGVARNISYNGSWDFRSKILTIDVKSSDITYMNGMAIYISFGDTTFAKYAQTGIVPTALNVSDGIWARKTITPLDWSFYAGSSVSDLANVKSIRLTISNSAGGASSAKVDRLAWRDSILKNGAIVFTFDDGKDNIFTNAAPCLDKYGYPGVVYAITSNVGKSGFMTLAQLKTLRDKGWIIGSHAVSHVHLYSITTEELAIQLKDSHDYLLNNGFAPGHKHLAYPFGENNASVREQARILYSTALSTTEKYFPEGAVDRMEIPRKEIKSSKYPSVTPLLTILDTVKAQKQLLIVYCHNILGSGGDWTPSEFQQIVDYVATIGLDVLTIEDVAQMYGLNALD